MEYEEAKALMHVSAQTGRAMPAYKCIKKVWAVKIKEIVHEKMPTFTSPNCRGSIALGSACGHCERCRWQQTHGLRMGSIIVPDDEGFGPFAVDPEYILLHKPVPGGYYVVYKDGYRSFSPAMAFEEGYVKL